jgi:PBSX family phage terminase large subunit
MIEFTPHSEKQDRAIFSEKKIILLATGIQYGKTSAGAVFIRKLIHEHWDINNNFIVTAPTFKILRQSTLPAFINIMGELGKYSSTDSTYIIKDGPTIYFRTNTHPDSVVGITNVMGIWGDEAGKYSLYFWENIQARSSFKGCQVMLTTSPYSLNWVYKELISSVQKGKRLDEIELIQAASYENPYFPMAEYERKKKTMDPRRFNMVYGGEWSKQEGLVYDCFNDDDSRLRGYTFPIGTKYYGGIDWGHRDPFVLIIRAITPFDYVIEVSEVYKSGLRPSQIKEILLQKMSVFNVVAFYADPSRPDLIQEFQAARIPVIPADNSIQKGIDLHYELIKSGNYKIIDGQCPNLIDEYETYHYSEEKDLQPDQNSYKSREVPVDQSNHCMDAVRYLTVGTNLSKIKLTPKVHNVLKIN